MKKETYCAVMRKVKMSEDCVGGILDAIDEVQVETTEKKVNHVKLIPLLTVAIVFVFGSVTVVAANSFEWLKNFFRDDVVLSEDIMEMAGEMEDFKYTSDIDIELSPLGVLATTSEIYCMFRIDDIQDGYSGKGAIFSMFWVNDKIPGFEDGSSSYGTAYCYSKIVDENVIAMPLSSDIDSFKDGDKIKLDISMRTDEYMAELEKTNTHEFFGKESDPLTTIEFTLKFGELRELHIDYNEYWCDDTPKRNYDFLFEKVVVTPLSINTYGDKIFYADEMLNNGFTIVLKDGTIIKTGNVGWSGSGSISEAGTIYDYEYNTSASFVQPINPDNITEIYLGEMKIYEKE